MNINYSLNRPSIAMKGSKLVPISEYTGVILKLTSGDKKKIAELQKQRAGLELDILKLVKLRDKKGNSDSLQFYYDDQIDRISNIIKGLENSIKAIKLNRFKKQQEKLLKTSVATQNKIDIQG